jgi:hypothetical protein
MATDNTLPHPLDGIPDGEYQQWLNHPCTIKVRHTIQQDMETAAAFIVAEAQRTKIEPENIRALGSQYQARRELDEIMFGRSS